MSSPTIKGKGTVRWGVDQVAVITNLEPQSVSMARTPAINKWIKGADGHRKTKIVGDDGYKATIKAVYYGGTTPADGAFLTVTIDSGGTTSAISNLICVECTWDYGNENELMLNISAESAQDLGSS